jgi:alpha-ketoglutarate-dependent taurine dioxygenase
MAAAAGGALSICDLYTVFDSLDDKVRAALSQLRCANSSGVVQPLVLRHPATGRTGLYTNMYSRVVAPNGQPLQPFEENIKKLLDRHAYKHEWQTGDITILDNFAVTHKACPGAPDNLEVLQRVQTVASGTWWQTPRAVLSKCNAALSAKDKASVA